MDYTIRIGGQAGQGVQTVGEVLSLAFARLGLHVFTSQDYESRIRGGYNFYQIRVGDAPLFSAPESVDILVALDGGSIVADLKALKPGGVLAYDEAIARPDGDFKAVSLPLKRLALESGGSAIMANTVAVGAVFGILGAEPGGLDEVLRHRFHKKGSDVIDANVSAARAGYDFARENCTSCSFISLKAGRAPMKLINASEAAAIGAIASGLGFYAAYPMTPSTGVMNQIAARAPRHGIVVEQAEDEIAAINMALGASFAGARAATGSSGGGFALMAEGLSLAAMTETPVVIFEVQRPGPATGLPTRTEQADLLFIINAGHGEFPRVVFAPGTPEETLRLTNKAFHLAEKYQVPAFVVFDQYLADSQWSMETLGTDGLVYKDFRLRGAEFAALDSYNRYALTPSGVSPLGVPGDAPHLVAADSDEHDEAGHMIEDAPMRIAMNSKRIDKKIAALRAEIAPPLYYGPDGAGLLLVCWGSSYGPVREAVDRLNAKGGEGAAMMFFSEVWPLPDDKYYAETIRNAARSICVEGNATGQLEYILRAGGGVEFSAHIRRYDGRPLSPEFIEMELKNVID